MPAHSGRRLLLAASFVIVPVVAACTGIAGISGYAVDPCFDGCDGAADAAPDVAPDAGGDVTQPPAEGGTDAGVDAPPCACPAGTKEISGVCAIERPPANTACVSPLQIPGGCKITVVVNLCDGDPMFDYAPECQGDAGVASRSSAFFQLGVSPTGKTKAVIRGAYAVARPNALCTEGGKTCAAGGTATSTFTNLGYPDNDRIAVGKRDDAVCHDISLELSPAPL